MPDFKIGDRLIGADAPPFIIAEMSGNSMIAAVSKGMLDCPSRFKRDLVALKRAERLTIEENMALAWSRGERRGLRLSLNRSVRELFRDKLAVLRLGFGRPVLYVLN